MADKIINTKMEFSEPKAFNGTKELIGTFAEAVANHLDYKPRSGNLEPIISNLGGTVKYNSWDESVGAEGASLKVKKTSDFVIYLSALCGPNRNRFSIAHELGHYLLHFVAQDRKEPMLATRNGDSTQRVEWEANWFAGSFLMPEKEFSSFFKTYGGNFDLLAIHFNVSVAATKVRARILSLN